MTVVGKSSLYIRYTLLRLLIFFGCVLVAWLLGVKDNPVLLLGIAAVASVVISFAALRHMRDEMVAQIEQSVSQRIERKEAQRGGSAPKARRADSDEAAEDAEIDRD